MASRRHAHQPGQKPGCQAHCHRPAPAQPGPKGGLLATSPARQRRRPGSEHDPRPPGGGSLRCGLRRRLDERSPSWYERTPTSSSRRKTSPRQGHPETFVVWDGRRGGPAHYHTDRGYAQEGVAPALSGTYTFTLAAGHVVECRSAFELLKELAAQYAPERLEELTWVPAGDVRRAVRLFATEQPSCYNSWVGIEQHTNAMQINRAVCLLCLTGSSTAGSNVLFASTPTHHGARAAAPEQARDGSARPSVPWGRRGTRDCASLRRVPPSSRATLPGEGLSPWTDLLLGRGTRCRQGGPGALDFYVHVDMFANPAAFADLLLPACTCWEREALSPSFDDCGRYRHLGAAQAARGPAAARVAIGPGDPL